MAGHGQKFGRKKEAAIAALLVEATVAAAAREAGVAERTLHNWMRDPDFAQEYARARRQYLEHAISRLERAGGEAVTAMIHLLGDDDSAVVLRAAQAIFDRGMRGAEMLDILQRLQVLEDAHKRRSSR
jgi:transposase-like protein